MNERKREKQPGVKEKLKKKDKNQPKRDQDDGG